MPVLRRPVEPAPLNGHSLLAATAIQRASVIALDENISPQYLGPCLAAFRLRKPNRWGMQMSMIYFEDLNVGDSWTTTEHPVDREEMLAYSRANDPWPIHIDPEAASKSPFGGLIASGGYTISLMYRLFHEVVNQPDRTWAFLGGFDWQVKFPEPVRAGDRLHERITIIEKRRSSMPGTGIIKDRVEVINDRKSVVLSVEATVLLATRSRGE